MGGGNEENLKRFDKTAEVFQGKNGDFQRQVNFPLIPCKRGTCYTGFIGETDYS